MASGSEKREGKGNYEDESLHRNIMRFPTPLPLKAASRDGNVLTGNCVKLVQYKRCLNCVLK